MFVHSFNLSAVHSAIILGFSWHLETCKKKNSIYLNSYTLFSCILRKIIISTSPWQPGSKNRKDCPILHIYQRIKGCYCKLFLEHSGLNLNCVTAINSPIVCVYPRDGLSYFLKVVKRYLGGTWQLMA